MDLCSMEWEKIKQGQRVQLTPTKKKRHKAHVWRGHSFLLLGRVTYLV